MKKKALYIRGATIHYEERGEGKVLVLLHGNAGSHRYFERQIEFFSNYYRVIAFDSRGHGKSEFGDTPLTIRNMAEELHQALEMLSIDHCYLLGFSDGGNIALQYGILFPERVDAMAVVAANVDPSALDKVTRFSYGCLHKITKALGKIFRRSHQLSQIFRLVAEDPDISLEELKHILWPTLVMAGERDVVDREHTKDIAAHIPNAQLEIISETGHGLLKDKPDEVNPLILKFFQSRESNCEEERQLKNR